jgi:hypothetical protein
VTTDGDFLAEVISAGVAEALRNNQDRHTRWRTGLIASIVDETNDLRQVEVQIDGDPSTQPTRMRSLGEVIPGQRALVVFTDGGGVWCLGALGGVEDPPGGMILLYGPGPPLAAIGEEGDWYVDTLNGCLYGPKLYTGGYTTPERISTGPGPATHLPSNQNHGIRLRFVTGGIISKIRYQRTEAMYSDARLQVWDSTNTKVYEKVVPDTGQPAGWYEETLTPPCLIPDPDTVYTISHSNGGYGASTLPAPPVTDTTNVKFVGFYYGTNSGLPPTLEETCPVEEYTPVPTIDILGAPTADRTGECGVQVRFNVTGQVQGIRYRLPASALDQTLTLRAWQGSTLGYTYAVEQPPPAFMWWADFLPGSSSAFELGSRVTFNVDGQVTKIHYTRRTTSSATMTFRVWNSAGSEVVAAFTDTSSGDGRRAVTLPTPLDVTAGQTYTFSMSAPVAPMHTTFATGITNGLHATFAGFYQNTTAGAFPNTAAPAERCHFVQPGFVPTGSDEYFVILRPGGGPLKALHGETWTFSYSGSTGAAPYDAGAPAVADSASVTFLSMRRNPSAGSLPVTTMLEETYFLEPVFEDRIEATSLCWGSNIEPTFQPIGAPVWPRVLCGGATAAAPPTPVSVEYVHDGPFPVSTSFLTGWPGTVPTGPVPGEAGGPWTITHNDDPSIYIIHTGRYPQVIGPGVYAVNIDYQYQVNSAIQFAEIEGMEGKTYFKHHPLPFTLSGGTIREIVGSHGGVAVIEPGDSWFGWFRVGIFASTSPTTYARLRVRITRLPIPYP